MALNVVVPRKAISDAVNAVGRAVTGKTPLPILNSLLVRAKDGQLYFSGTDLQVGISCHIPAHVISEGAFVVPAKSFADVLSNLPDKSDVSLTMVEGKHDLSIRSEKSKTSILGLPEAEYPALAEVRTENGFTIAQAVLRDILSKTLTCIGKDDTRPNITGICIEVREDVLNFVGTDTHKLAHVTVEGAIGRGEATCILPGAQAVEVSRLLSTDDGDVQVRISDTHIEFAIPGEMDLKLISRVLEGQFPSWRRVVPASPAIIMKLSRQLLAMAVRRCSVVAKQNAERIVFTATNKALSGDVLTLTAESQLVGDSEEEIEVLREKSTEDLVTAFNGSYLRAILESFENESLTIESDNGLKPSLIRPVVDGAPAGGATCYFVMMPMQIK